MNGSERWVAMSALGAAMFAVGFSFAGVACSSRDTSVAEAARAVDSVSVNVSAVPAPAASLGNATRAVSGAPIVVPVVPSAGATGVSKAPLPSDIAVGSEGLKLKRLVVTHQIENREPLAGDEFSLGSAPVYAFLELENSAKEARTVQVMFQNLDTKATVGHVKLSVPAAQGRFRTWGNTRLIRDAGHWVAVVSTTEGVELGRAPFDVKG